MKSNSLEPHDIGCMQATNLGNKVTILFIQAGVLPYPLQPMYTLAPPWLSSTL
jgi:hypothetical protein